LGVEKSEQTFLYMQGLLEKREQKGDNWVIRAQPTSPSTEIRHQMAHYVVPPSGKSRK